MHEAITEGERWEEPDACAERDRLIGRAVEESGWTVGDLAELFNMSPRRIAHLGRMHRADIRAGIAEGEPLPEEDTSQRRAYRETDQEVIQALLAGTDPSEIVAALDVTVTRVQTLARQIRKAQAQRNRRNTHEENER